MRLYRILLVDDELFFRQGLRAIIDWESCGYEVIGEEDNGEDAFHFIIKHQPEVVITDIRMPECDGLQLIHKVVHEAKLKTKFIIVSGYDEFKYAQQAVKYGVCDFLLKPIDEQILENSLIDIAAKLQSEKKQSRHSLMHHHEDLINIILQEQPTNAQLINYYSNMKLQVTEQYYFVFIENNYYPVIKSRDLHQIDQLQNYLELLNELLPQFESQYLYPQQGKLGLIIKKSWLREYSSITSLMKQLHRKLSLLEEGTIHLYYSPICEGINFLKEAYEAAEYVQQFKYYDNRQLFDYNDFKSYTLRHIMLPAERYKQLLQEMEENDEQRISTELDLLFSSFSAEYCSIEAIKASLHKLVADCLQILHEMEIDKNRLSKLNTVLTWDHYNIEWLSLRNLMLTFLLECGSAIAEERKEMSKGGIQRIKKYIDQHYAEQISLKTIASQFYINPVYLGQLFKKTYDSYFNDYLLQIRINEAKKLLRQTDLRIYEIAEKVGFNHPEYFVAQFEKTEKLSPKAYRQTFHSTVGE